MTDKERKKKDEEEKEKLRKELMDENLPYEERMKKYQDYLRTHQTPYEKKLWFRFLRYGRKHGIVFKRQSRFASFIVDFYCPNARLVIEVDGSQHYTPEGRKVDIKRTQFIESDGTLVIRYSNKEVWFNFEGVCLDILKALHERLGRSDFDWMPTAGGRKGKAE